MSAIDDGMGKTQASRLLKIIRNTIICLKKRK
ncbi:MAG: hypothetical protein F6K52_02700 [Moorea sp. SIO3H5]|nr:hypothetical protein [Moorena sp. SIO3H5]